MKAFTKRFRSGLLLLAAATTCHAQGAPDDFLDGVAGELLFLQPQGR
jgi:hypothetical protein